MRAKLSLLFGAGLVASVGWIGVQSSDTDSQPPRQPGVFVCSVASISDGDTLRCHESDSDGRQIRVRLAGIAARERDGDCSPGHPCPPATAEEATAELVRLAAGDTLACTPTGMTYRRVAAFCVTSAGVDLSCAMVASGTAARWGRYWQGHRCG